MNLTWWEFRKLWRAPALRIATAVLTLVTLYAFFFGYQDGYKAQQTPLATEITRLQADGAYFAGKIDEDWIAWVLAEEDAFINDPENQVPQSERETVRDAYRARGLTEQAIDKMGEWIYLKEEVALSNDYQRFEDAIFSTRFYDYARETGDDLARQYRERYPGKKGSVLAAETERLYRHLADDYTAYYNYDWGYWKLRGMHTLLPFTVGIILLVGLAPLFSGEYAERTDALILSSRHGKGRLPRAKIRAGLLFAVLVWTGAELLTAALAFGFYGVTGAESYWQNWVTDYAPFPLNNGQITLITVATSLLGALFLAGALMAVSAVMKNTFLALAAGGVVLLLPSFDAAFSVSPFLQKLFNFMPTRVLSAIQEWQRFDLCYLFGKPVQIQYVVLTAAALGALALPAVGTAVFRRHQVENG